MRFVIMYPAASSSMVQSSNSTASPEYSKAMIIIICHQLFLELIETYRDQFMQVAENQKNYLN